MKLPQFDCRYFQIESEIEAINALIARQNDCKRNAIQSIGQYYYSHKELLNKTITDIEEMIVNDKKIKKEEFLSLTQNKSMSENIEDNTIIRVEDYHSHYIYGRLITRTVETKINQDMEEYTRAYIKVEDKTLPFRKRFDNIFIME